MGDILITKSASGLGFTKPSKDHVLGAIFYNDYLPAGWLPSIDAWVTATAYVIGDKVYDSVTKNFYICNTGHTSGATFAGDIANWDIYTKTVKKISSLLEAETAGIVKGSTDWDYEWYQLSEIFRIDANAEVYVYAAAVPSGAYDYTELNHIMSESLYEPRTVGIFAKDVTFATAELNKIQILVDALVSDFKSAINVSYTADITSFATVADLPDLSALSTDAGNVSVVIGRDAGNYGATLGEYADLGAVLGLISLSKVSDSIAWVGEYNVANIELETVALTNGLLINDLSKTNLDLITEKRYIAFIKRQRVTGTYCNDSLTAASVTSDYNTIEYNRVYNKAYMGIIENVTPFLNSPLVVNASGQMTPGTIGAFKTAIAIILESMKSNVEISNYRIYIDPSQNVISTSKVEAVIKMTPVGVARELEFTLGFEV